MAVQRRHTTCQLTGHSSGVTTITGVTPSKNAAVGFQSSKGCSRHSDALHVRIGDQFRGIDSAGIASIRRAALSFHRPVGEEHGHHIIGYGHGFEVAINLSNVSVPVTTPQDCSAIRFRGNEVLPVGCFGAVQHGD